MASSSGSPFVRRAVLGHLFTGHDAIAICVHPIEDMPPRSLCDGRKFVKRQLAVTIRVRLLETTRRIALTAFSAPAMVTAQFLARQEAIAVFVDSIEVFYRHVRMGCG